MSFPTPMGIVPVRLIVNDLEVGLEPAAQGLLHGREPLALPIVRASSWRVLADLSDGCCPPWEVLWVRGVGEHLLHGTVYLDAFFDAYHVGSPPTPQPPISVRCARSPCSLPTFLSRHSLASAYFRHWLYSPNLLEGVFSEVGAWPSWFGATAAGPPTTPPP